MTWNRHAGGVIAFLLLSWGSMAAAQDACESEVVDTDECLEALEVVEQETANRRDAAEDTREAAEEGQGSEGQQPAPQVQQAPQAGAPAVEERASDAAPSAQAPGDAPADDSRAQATGNASRPNETRAPENPENSAAASSGAIDETEALELVGNDVKTRLDEDVGEITRIVRSRLTNELVVVADIGGFLGLGVHTVALPMRETELDAEGGVVTDLSREELELMPEFDARDYAALR